MLGLIANCTGSRLVEAMAAGAPAGTAARYPGRIIRACSSPEDVVLDPFGGSGTALVATKKLSRRFPGFELSRAWAAAIRHRLDAVRLRMPLERSPEPTAGGKERGMRA